MTRIRDYERRVAAWLIDCFGITIAEDRTERNHRFLEEALELVQSGGCTREAALELVDYVYSRPTGVMHQEVGGVMNTLASLCFAHDVSLDRAATDEMDRVEEPAMMAKIRAKQAAKPKFSSLAEARDG